MSRWSEDVGSVMIPPGGEIESDQIASMFLNVQYSPFYEGTPHMPCFAFHESDRLSLRRRPEALSYGFSLSASRISTR